MSGSRARILIVDDAGPVVVLCVNVLQALGYYVKGANRGETAVDLLQREPFDLVVLDYKMPGMTGFQVFEQARALFDAQVDQIHERTARGAADLVSRSRLVARQTVQRAVEVQIGGVNQLHARRDVPRGAAPARSKNVRPSQKPLFKPPAAGADLGPR